MKNLNSMINGLSKTGVLSGFAGGVVSGALTGRLTRGLTSKKGRKMGKSALQLGALAAVGGVAWKAYQAYSHNNALNNQSAQAAGPAPTPAQSRYIPSEGRPSLTYSPASLSQQQFEQVVNDERNEPGQMIILRAMITAANADGHIDENERQQIYQQVDNLTLSVTDKARLFDELRRPLSLQELVNAVPNSETAIEVYAASVLAIDERQGTSKDYLKHLASSLFIPRELVNAVHSQADVMQE